MMPLAAHFSVPTFTVYINLEQACRQYCVCERWNKQTLSNISVRPKHGPCGKGRQTIVCMISFDSKGQNSLYLWYKEQRSSRCWSFDVFRLKLCSFWT